MDRFYSIFVDSDDDSSLSYLRKKNQRICIIDAISSHCPYFATSLMMMDLNKIHGSGGSARADCRLALQASRFPAFTSFAALT
ncbi:MAG: hypothetical protein ABIJ03_02440 [Patescibacteria group bacterium]